MSCDQAQEVSLHLERLFHRPGFQTLQLLPHRSRRLERTAWRGEPRRRQRSSWAGVWGLLLRQKGGVSLGPPDGCERVLYVLKIKRKVTRSHLQCCGVCSPHTLLSSSSRLWRPPRPPDDSSAQMMHVGGATEDGRRGEKRVFLLPAAAAPARLASRTEESGERGGGGEAEGGGLGGRGSRRSYLRHLSKQMEPT